MPRAVDPSLFGQQLPIDHSPLNRIEYRYNKPEFDLEDILESIKVFIADFLFPAIKALTGIDLSVFLPLLDILELDFSSPLAFIQSVINVVLAVPGALLPLFGELLAPLQGVIDLILGGLSGIAGGIAGVDPLAVVFGLFNQVLQAPIQLLGLLFGQQATTTAQVNAINNGGFAYDAAANGVTGWTNLTGTLALSSRGKYIQAPNVTVAYRSSGVANDRYGAHIVTNLSMQGACRIGICATSTASNYAALEVYRGFDGDALRVVTGASPTLAVVQRQADFIGVNRLGASSLDIRTDGVNKFTVLRDGQPVPALDWTDTGGIVTHGASNRNVVLASNSFDRNEDSFYGPAISKVVSYAW
jgi:hypothetical protein